MPEAFIFKDKGSLTEFVSSNYCVENKKKLNNLIFFTRTNNILSLVFYNLNIK